MNPSLHAPPRRIVVLGPRLCAADVIVLFDLSVVVCAWRAIRRSRERIDFWRWLLTWRRRYRPLLIDAIRTDAANAELLLIRNRRDRERVLRDLTSRVSRSPEG